MWLSAPCIPDQMWAAATAGAPTGQWLEAWETASAVGPLWKYFTWLCCVKCAADKLTAVSRVRSSLFNKIPDFTIFLEKTLETAEASSVFDTVTWTKVLKKEVVPGILVDTHQLWTVYFNKARARGRYSHDTEFQLNQERLPAEVMYYYTGKSPVHVLHGHLYEAFSVDLIKTFEYF